MMGILLAVPELRDQLDAAIGGRTPDGDKLANIVVDWVSGRPLEERAAAHFAGDGRSPVDPVDAMTDCCRNLFGRLTQTTAWGIAALQALTIRDRLDEMPASEAQTLRNLPARIFYGVNSDEAIALRLLGVPRRAAAPLAKVLGVSPSESLSVLRARLARAGVDPWRQALGAAGEAYARTWAILEP
jgi:hypothetical protein